MTSYPAKQIEYTVRDDQKLAVDSNRSYNMLANARARQFETNFDKTAWQPRVAYQSEAHNLFRSSRMPVKTWLDAKTRRFMQVHTERYKTINAEKVQQYGSLFK